MTKTKVTIEFCKFFNDPPSPIYNLKVVSVHVKQKGKVRVQIFPFVFRRCVSVRCLKGTFQKKGFVVMVSILSLVNEKKNILMSHFPYEDSRHLICFYLYSKVRVSYMLD